MSAGVAEVKELARREGLQSWVGCMPSAGGGCPGFTITLSDNHFHNPKAAPSSCSGGLWRSRYVHRVRVPSATPTVTPAATFARPLCSQTVPGSADVSVLPGNYARR